MFYCNPCADEKGWPKDTLITSRGHCEICGKHGVCNDVPSRALPMPKPKPMIYQTPKGEEIDITAILAADNLPAIIESMLEEIHLARPLVDAIAEWERANGTAAAIMPDEYGGFFLTFAKAAIHGSARGSQSVRYDRKDVDE